ncbi:hypothetical protein IJH89_02920 [Candidatus Saccharibacteria bacterium]|nr:hypothetical protein [Candidatus Saccharibacteria bacterium]
MSKQPFKNRLLKFFDDLGLAGRGLLLATRKKSFWPPFLLTFFIFGILINLLSSGVSVFSLMFSSPAMFFKLIGSAFLGLFGFSRNFLDWILNFFLTLLQSILVALVVLVFRHNKSARSSESVKPNRPSSDSSGLESSALVAGLALLGSGCPTCGTTLLAPLLSTVVSGVSGGVALAGKLSFLFNFLAFILALLAFKKLGLETYAIIKSDNRNQRIKNSKEATTHETRPDPLT